MESGSDEIAPSQGVHVKVSTKNCLKEIGGKLKPSVEDNNRNLTRCTSALITAESYGSSSKHVSYNGPNGLVNGVDLDKYEVQFSDSNVSVKNDSSPCEKCPGQAVGNDSKAEAVESDSGEVKFALECKKALQELILDSSQECCETGDSSNKCSDPSEHHVHNERLEAVPHQVSESSSTVTHPEIMYVSYENEHQMPDIMRLIQKDLSEPYSIYTYRYFIHKWPQLCFLAMDEAKCVGAIVCKLDIHRKVIRRGYIAMLAVDEKYRKRKIGTNLVLKAIRAMVADNADEIVLETEITNNSALCLYENLGFVRDKRLFRYYLNGVDALRLKLWLR